MLAKFESRLLVGPQAAGLIRIRIRISAQQIAEAHKDSAKLWIQIALNSLKSL